MFPRALLLMVTPLVPLLAACGDREAKAAEKDVMRLQATLPVLAAYRVRAYRHQPWCQALEYARGRFATDSKESCAGILDGNRRPFDQTARRDIEAIRKAMREAADDLQVVNDLEYSADGRPVRGVFDCSEGHERRVYFYDPGYTLPTTAPPGASYYPVNEQWYRLAPTAP
ncbi:MAG: hypothetical protein HKN82_14145 [Akkermansiaceae bacterium]|nr:hypothetical protein [Akkermansiaceae bacterium]